MDFYSYSFFVHQSQHTNVTKYIIFIVLLILLLLLILKQFRTLEKMKYRDLVILLSLTIIFFVGIQVNDYEVGKLNQNNSSQMVGFLDKLAKNQHVKAIDLAVNSQSIRDEMIVKIGDDYYQVEMNPDLSSYKLEETFLIQDKVNVIIEGD
ncbi:DUF3290 family protein [Vagococcus vulneris]|uniref:DUF3290 domain-containing protein n=1 Tax=Vagococcus vulneris TaxID=1977869 RepID=A0A429ZVB0_9ENTE|nr:DUF3290 family protein [Vagococcus vulneris]RST97631.1 hypothetical protein CBF37_09675 [Vagococcus vulneris]